MQSVKDSVSETEWQTRVDLAACYRAVAMYGWDDLIFTHISARVPGEHNHFLINPYGMMFDEVTASSLVKVNLNADKVMESDYDINPAGFIIHSAVHEAREDAQCVMHLHTTDGVAVSVQDEGLLPLSQQSLFPLASLAYHDYEGVALEPDEKARLVSDLGNAQFMILRNHGLLTCAESIPDAFLFTFILQRACEIQLKAQASSAPLTHIDQRIVDGIREQAAHVTHQAGGGLAWPGILRRLDRLMPGYDK